MVSDGDVHVSRADDVSCDAVVVGAGAVGLALALGLSRAGIGTAVVGPAGEARPGRTVALLDGSVRLLERLGVWPDLEPHAAPLAHMRIVDATGSLFRGPPVQFDAAEIGHAAFGFNIANSALEEGLADVAARQPGLTFIPDLARTYRFGPDSVAVETGDRRVTAKLLIAADGRHSLARKAAGIGTRSRTWPQTALTAIFRHRVSHRDTSTEFHTRDGPFTLVPLPGSERDTHRSSLVWVMKPEDAERRRRIPEEFATLVERQAERLLGAMVLEGPIGSFPIATSTAVRLTGERLVLTGEAAHALPPIGAQGLNLSLRDVATLVASLDAAHRRGQDIGGAQVLDRYANDRKGDVAVRSMAVDALNGSLLARSPLADLARGAGLMSLRAFGPLRRLAMRHGLVPQGNSSSSGEPRRRA